MKITNSFRRGLRLFAFIGVLSVSAFAQQFQPTEIAANLSDPSKLVVLPGGSFLTVQAGVRPNRGALFYIDSQGDQTWILVGLPGPAKPLSAPVPTAPGPDGLAIFGNTLFIATGQLTADGSTSTSNTQASILKVTFSRSLANSPGPFALQPADYQTLLNGGTVTLTISWDNTATVSLLVNSVNAPSDLSVDPVFGRLYIVSRADHTISWVPLQ
jgi:hypothetical protein